VIGGYYARAQGLPAAVATRRSAIITSRRGRGTKSRPTRHRRLNIADRLDTLVALLLDRREADRLARSVRACAAPALGFLQLLTRNNLRLPLSDVLVQAAVLNIVSRLGAIGSVTFPDLLDSDDHEHEITAEVGSYTYRHGDRVVVRWKAELTPNIERGKIIEEAQDLSEAILDFLGDRLKVQQREAGVRHDLIDAVFARRSRTAPPKTISSACSPGSRPCRKFVEGRKRQPARRLQACRQYPQEGGSGTTTAPGPRRADTASASGRYRARGTSSTTPRCGRAQVGASRGRI
jgi:glycyl-tRNA synthetase beta subunit